jgi:predicted dehydrogenase/uncharacterized membrane protein
MNFALLGGDATVRPLVRAIAADSRHRLKTAVLPPTSQGYSEIPGMLTELLAIAPGVRIESQWEGLPHDAGIDAVIAVVGNAAVDECVKQSAAAGKPALFVPNGDPASSLVYELTLVRDDTGVKLIPFFPLRFAGPLRAVAACLRNGKLGEPLNLQWSRDVVPANTVGRPSKAVESERDSRDGLGRPPYLLSPRDVHRALIHDADILRQLGGNYSQVTAVRSGEPETGFSMVTVTLAGNRLPTATWTIRPAAERPSFELVVPTNAGVVALRGSSAAGEIPDSETGRIGVSGTHEVVEKLRAAATGDVARSILDQLDGATSQGFSEIPGMWEPPDWSDLLRATEIVEAAERSLRRRRTIDLHFETTSERSQFKTQMTAIGCGLMSMTLVSFVFLLMAGALFNVHPLAMKIARVGIIVPLVLFLLLQALLFVSRPPKAEEQPASKAGAGKRKAES